jgi:hypothetical protein
MIQSKITSYLNLNQTKKRKKEDNYESESESEYENLTKRIMSISLNSSYSLYKYKYTTDKLNFKHNSIEAYYNTKSESFCIKAEKFIPKGTLLCIEEGIIGDLNHICFVLKNRTDIAKELYPRNTLDVFTSVANLNFNDSELCNKIIHNSWEWKMNNMPLRFKEDSTSILCPFICKFNHSCISNAFVRAITISELESAKDENEYKGGIIIYSVKNIQPGEEITVSYGFDVGHPVENEEDNNNVFNWTCECGKSEKERCLYFHKCYREAKFWWNEDKEYVGEHILKNNNE